MKLVAKEGEGVSRGMDVILTTSLLSISVNLFYFYSVHQFVVFFRFHL